MFENFGIDDSGFRLPTFADAQAEVRAELGERLGYEITDETTLAGILADVFAEALVAVWESHYLAWLSFQLAAEGVSLNHVVQQVGIYPRSNAKSTGSVYLIGTMGSPVPSGSQFTDDETGAVWETLADGDADTPLGDLVPAQAVLAGPTAAGITSSFTVSSVPGWTDVQFAADAIPGYLTESPAELRARHASVLVGEGKATAEGVPVRAAVLAVTGVTDVTVEINDTNVIVNGVAGYSMRVTADGGLDSDVAAAIWNSKRLGGGTSGLITVVVVDDDGENHSIKFSRPSVVPIQVDVTVTAGSGFPVDGQALVQAAITDFINGLGLGVDVSHPGMISAVYTSVPGITEINLLLDEEPGTPTPNTYPIAKNQKAGVGTISVTVI